MQLEFQDNKNQSTISCHREADSWKWKYFVCFCFFGLAHVYTQINLWTYRLKRIFQNTLNEIVLNIACTPE